MMEHKIKNQRICLMVGQDRQAIETVRDELAAACCNFTVADTMKDELLRHGFLVQLSYQQGGRDALCAEMTNCKDYRPDLVIALQMHAGHSFAVSYQAQDWDYIQQSQRLADCVQRKIKAFFPEGCISAACDTNLGWLHQSKAPAILCEFFVRTGSEVQWYTELERLKTVGIVYAKAVLDFYGVPCWPDTVQTLRYSVLHKDWSRKDYSNPAVLLDGSWYLELRHCAKQYGFEVHSEHETGRLLLYDTRYYIEIAGEQRLICISDFQTREEAILAGLTEEVWRHSCEQ